tara:strand:+ start:1785 stop:2675 length:891 start_codon:yes stop_codon:yes gene_type:complete
MLILISSYFSLFFTFYKKKVKEYLLMVEMNKKKYEIGVRRFNSVNWVGAFNLYKKETLRFLIVFGQTLFGPIVTSILFLLVISLAIGEERANVLGVSYIQFLAPGLIVMQVIQQSFAHSSSSLIMGKMMGTISDIISSPLNSTEVTLAIILASVTRGIIISSISILVFYFAIDLKVYSFGILILYLFLGSFLLGAAGFIAGLHCEKFDHMATITNFFIVPLSFLSGTFYSIEKLPIILQKISLFNPFFHIIDGFRYAVIGNSDGPIFFGFIYLLLLSFLLWIVCFYLYKKGYKIKF